MGQFHILAFEVAGVILTCRVYFFFQIRFLFFKMAVQWHCSSIDPIHKWQRINCPFVVVLVLLASISNRKASQTFLCDGDGRRKLMSEKISSFTTVFVDTRLSKTKHPRKRFQNFRQSYTLSTDRIEIHKSQPARRKEGPKVTLVAVIGGYWSYFSITCVIDGNFGNVFAAVLFSKVNENGDNMKGLNKCNDLA